MKSSSISNFGFESSIGLEFRSRLVRQSSLLGKILRSCSLIFGREILRSNFAYLDSWNSCFRFLKLQTTIFGALDLDFQGSNFRPFSYSDFRLFAISALYFSNPRLCFCYIVLDFILELLVRACDSLRILPDFSLNEKTCFDDSKKFDFFRTLGIFKLWFFRRDDSSRQVQNF